MILQLNPPLTLITPLGEAIAYFIQDEADTIWFGVFQKETAENWWWENSQVRLAPCMSDGRVTVSPITLKEPMEEFVKRHRNRSSKP
jgi:hypothetical protein